jgi:hypothetical protein
MEDNQSGPLEQSMNANQQKPETEQPKDFAQTAGEDAQAAVDKGTVWAETGLNDIQKGAIAAKDGADGIVAGVEVMANKAEAALADFKQHSAAGQAGSIVQSAIAHMESLLNIAKGMLWTHKDGAGIAPTDPVSPASRSVTANMSPEHVEVPETKPEGGALNAPTSKPREVGAY